MASYLWPGRADDTYVRASFQTQDRSSGEGIRLRVVDKLGVSTAVCVRKRCLVRAEGLEPSRTLRSNGFSCPLRLSPPPTAFAMGFGVWTIPSPCPDLARDRHFTGFPEFEQFCTAGFPTGTQVLSLKSDASANSATPARFQR